MPQPPTTVATGSHIVGSPSVQSSAAVDVDVVGADVGVDVGVVELKLELERTYTEAAVLISKASYLIIGAGAGMGVDSGLVSATTAPSVLITW